MGILVNTGFDVGSSNPIDSRTVKNTTDERDELVTDGLVYENLKVYCKDTQTEYRWTGTEWEEVGSGGTVDLSEYTKTYTSLSQLGLTAPITVGEIFNAMPNKTMAVIACEAKDESVGTVTVSDIPESYGVLTIKKNGVGRLSIEYQNSSYNTACNVKKWIGTLKGADGTGLVWKQLSSEPTFTTLSDIGLTADATFQDVVDALPKGGSALLGVKDFTNYQTIFPYEEGNDQFARVYIVKGLEDGSCMYARWFRKDGSKEAIAIFNTNDNKFNGWRMLKNQQVYTTLTELGLDTTAKINDIVGAMKDGTIFTYKTDVFDYATEYNNIQLGTVTINKQSAARVQALMTDKSTGNLYVGKLGGNNQIDGWTKVITENSDPYACTSYNRLTGTEDLFTLPCGHYVAEKADTAYNYPITDSDKVTAHIYVLGHLNIPANNQGYRIILYFDNKGRTYSVNEWWGVFGSWNRLDNDTRLTTLETQVNELFQSVSNGKTAVANAITDKGVSTSSTATFATMATNISKIPQTTTWKEETVSATPDSNSGIARFVFSNTVFGVRQITAPGYNYTAGVQETKMFTLNGNTVEVKLEKGSGTWKMTAMVRA